MITDNLLKVSEELQESQEELVENESLIKEL